MFATRTRALVWWMVPAVALTACSRSGYRRAGGTEPTAVTVSSAPASSAPAVASAPPRVVATSVAPAAVPVAVPAVPASMVATPTQTASVVNPGPIAAMPADPPPPGAAPAPAAPPPSDPNALLEEQKKQQTIDAERRKVLLTNTLAQARAAAANGDVAGARTFYAQALELDPSSQEAREGLKNTTDDRTSTTNEFFERSRREAAVRREQAVQQVQSFMNTGRMLEAQEDFAGAIKQYQNALAIVGWWDNQAGFGVTSDSLRDLIDDVRHKADLKDRAVRAEQIRRGQVERERDLAREREERLGRIRAYFRDADLAYHAGEWARARADLVAVLREDPQNGGALRMKVMIDEAEHQTAWRVARQRFDEEWKSVMEQFQDAIQPQVDPVEFPKNWAEIARRTPRAVGDVSAPADLESKAAIMAILESKRVKGLTFQDANLDAVVQYLRTVTGLNFHITAKVRATKFDDTKVNIPLLDNVSVAEVLNIVTVPADLRWEPRDGVVTISTKEEVAGTLRLRYFDVKDLAVKIQNFRGTEIFLAPSNYTPPEPPELPEPQAIFPEEQLVDTIKSVVDPESWTVEGASLEVKNKLLIAKNTAETLDRVGEMLAELRSNSGPLVHLEVRFITVEDNFLRDVGVDVRGLGDNSQGQGAPGLGASVPQDDVFFGSPANPQGGPLGIHSEPSSVGTSNDNGVYYNDGADGGYQARVENLFDSVLGNPNVLTGSGGLAFQHTFLDDTQLEVILRAVEKSERIQTITASQLTVYNTQRATVEVLNKVAYVGDYDVEIAQNANIANPIIKHAVDGVVLDVKPVVSGDRRFVTLELRPTVATLVRPIPTFSTSLDSNIAPATVVIQVPKLQKSTVRTTVTMPDGGTLLLGGLKFYEQVDATSEVPILGQLPVLSFLFTRKGHYVNKRNLIILITVHVVALEELEPRGEFTPIPLPESIPVVPAPEPDLCPPMQMPPPSPCAAPPKPACGCAR